VLATPEQLDHSLLLAINGAHSPLMDVCMTWISRKTSWIPLYVLIGIYATWKLRINIIWILLGAAATIVITDMVSTQLIKDTVQRYRPCHNLLLKDSIHLVNGKCGGMYGFVSSHAANTAGLAAFIIASRLGRLTLRDTPAFILACVMMIYATINSYSRIYLGVHYPSDVIAGAMLGILAGILTGWAVRRVIFRKGK